MSKTLEELRADLARDAQLFFTGAASAGGAVGPPSTIIDTLGLGALFTETGALISGLAYIREAGGTAPEEESAWVVGYNATAERVDVEPPLSVAVGAGDTYELYLVPLSLADWNKCINEAIGQAWPKVWEREVYEVASAGTDEYALAAATPDAWEVLGVNVVMGGDYSAAPISPYPRSHWTTTGTPGADLILHLRRPIETADRTLQVVYKAKYPELAAGESTDLDYGYLMDAALSNLYAMLAGGAGPEAYSDRYLALVPYHRGLANEKLNELAMALAGVTVVGQVK